MSILKNALGRVALGIAILLLTPSSARSTHLGYDPPHSCAGNCGGGSDSSSGGSEAGRELGRALRGAIESLLESIFSGGDSSRGNDSERDYTPPRPDPRIAEFRNKLAAAQAAQGAGDLDRAMRLVREALALRDDPGLRQWLDEAEAILAANQAIEKGNAALKNNDLAQAIAFYREAMRVPINDTPGNRQFVSDLEARLKRELESQTATREREERERRNRPEAEQLNDQAVALLKAERLDEALAKLERALELLPYDPVISGNYWIAKANIAFRQGKLDETIADLENALKLDPDNRAAAATLELARARRTEQSARMQSAFEQSRSRLSAVLMDTSVVDARVAPWGAELLAQVPELERSPAADRIRKGYQGVITHDWPVALAWWKEALQRDPSNKALQRSVELAQWMVDRRKETANRPASPFDAALAAAKRGDDATALRLIEETARQRPELARNATMMTTIIRAYHAGRAEARNHRTDTSDILAAFQDSLAEELFFQGLIESTIGNEERARELGSASARRILSSVDNATAGSGAPSPASPAREPTRLDFIGN